MSDKCNPEHKTHFGITCSCLCHQSYESIEVIIAAKEAELANVTEFVRRFVVWAHAHPRKCTFSELFWAEKFLERQKFAAEKEKKS